MIDVVAIAIDPLTAALVDYFTCSFDGLSRNRRSLGRLDSPINYGQSTGFIAGGYEIIGNSTYVGKHLETVNAAELG